MKHEILSDPSLSYAPFRYGLSRQFFRGPRRNLDAPYVAFIGGTETYGKFIERPFPDLVEASLGMTCANFGLVNAGVDAYVNDPAIISACHDAKVTVIQILGAQNLSNRFYKVHPRRNDRFLSASTVMKAVYSDTDYADFSFNRHMLLQLYHQYAVRFDILRNELQEAWSTRMNTLIESIDGPVVLLWLSDQPLTDLKWNDRPEPFRHDPLFVTRTMVEKLMTKASYLVEVQPSVEARQRGTEGMVFPMLSSGAASEMAGVQAHSETATKLLPVLRGMLGH